MRLHPPALSGEAFASACVPLRSQCVPGHVPYDAEAGDAGLGLAAGTPYFIARDIPAKCVRTFHAPKSAPAARWTEIESVTIRVWGLAVLLDPAKLPQLSGDYAVTFAIAVPKISGRSPELDRNMRTGRSMRGLFYTVAQRYLYRLLNAEKVCVLEQPTIKVLPLSLAKGVRTPLPLPVGWREQWQIVNVMPGVKRGNKDEWKESSLLAAAASSGVSF